MLFDHYKHHKVINKNYKHVVNQVFIKNIGIIKHYGTIPYNYKQMELSPRIMFVNYRHTLNNTKIIVTNNVYTLISKHLDDYSIINFDVMLHMYSFRTLFITTKFDYRVYRKVCGITYNNNLRRKSGNMFIIKQLLKFAYIVVCFLAVRKL